MSATKKCPKCERVLPLEEFSARRVSADGLSGSCKRCNSSRNKCYYSRNKNSVLAKCKAYRSENPAKVASIHKSKHAAAVKKNPLFNSINGCRHRARLRGGYFCDDVSDLVIPEFCPVLGLHLGFGKGKHCRSSPSIDRMNSASPNYPWGRRRVISNRANTLKSNMTFSESIRVSAYILWCEVTLAILDKIDAIPLDSLHGHGSMPYRGPIQELRYGCNDGRRGGAAAAGDTAARKKHDEQADTAADTSGAVDPLPSQERARNPAGARENREAGLAALNKFDATPLDALDPSQPEPQLPPPASSGAPPSAAHSPQCTS